MYGSVVSLSIFLRQMWKSDNSLCVPTINYNYKSQKIMSTLKYFRCRIGGMAWVGSTCDIFARGRGRTSWCRTTGVRPCLHARLGGEKGTHKVTTKLKTTNKQLIYFYFILAKSSLFSRYNEWPFFIYWGILWSNKLKSYC